MPKTKKIYKNGAILRFKVWLLGEPTESYELVNPDHVSDYVIANKLITKAANVSTVCLYLTGIGFLLYKAIETGEVTEVWNLYKAVEVVEVWKMIVSILK